MVLLSLWLSVLLVLFPFSHAKDCKKIDKCKCSFDDGSGTVDLSTLGSSTGSPLDILEKIDKCKCSFDDGSGTVDLSTLGSSTGSPLIEDIFAPDNYAYSFDPCYPFTEGTCINALGCQFDSSNVIYYQIGDPDSVQFSYDGTNVIGTYSHTTRTTKVTYICDEQASTPQTSVNGEVGPAHYEFQITAKEACPMKPSEKHTCTKIDQCRCQFNDGLGIVDLADIGRQDGVPLFKDAPGMDGNQYSFNPCFPFEEDVCKDVALCQFETNTSLHYAIGDENDNEFYYDGHNVIVRYSSTNKGVTRTSIVTFICDMAATTPTLVALGEVAEAEYLFTVTTKGACPKPIPRCDKVDNCVCNMSDGSGMIDLSLVANQGGNPLVENVPGPDRRYRYFFNPCYPLTVGTCVNKSACLLDTQENRYYDIGDLNAAFTFDGTSVIATYTANNQVMGSKVSYICDRSANKTSTDVEGEISPALYGFKVTSKDLCLRKVTS